jgi:predicted dehydrogenase
MSRLRTVVVGVGANIWPLHRSALDAIGAELVAVHDRDAGATDAAAEAIGCRAAHGLGDLLAEPAELGVVLTPQAHHAEHAIACLEAGLHVLVEKPLAVSAGEADAMLATAERCRRLLAVALQQRTREEVQEARRLLADGALGELQRIDLLATWPRRSDYFTAAPWRAAKATAGGGLLLNQAQHDLDLICHLCGSPARVTARMRTAVHPVEAEDTVAALLEWPGGALGSLHVSSAEADELQRIEITGTGGRLRLRYGRLELWRTAPDYRQHAALAGDPFGPPAVEHMPALLGGGGGHAEVYGNLADAIAGRARLVAPAASAAAAVELANALIQSALEDGGVALPLDRDAYARLLAGVVRLEELEESPPET